MNDRCIDRRSSAMTRRRFLATTGSAALTGYFSVTRPAWAFGPALSEAGQFGELDATAAGGIDLYIEYLLKKDGLENVPFYSNRAEIVDSRLRITWPYAAHSCGDCGNCKGYHIRRLKADHHKVVYIGDGKSDICALPEADIIFARGFLADYCRENKIGFFAFDNFASVTDIMTTRLISEHENRV